jgi:flavorubredoxin
MKEMLKDSGVSPDADELSFKYVPDEAELAACFEFGAKFAEGLR